MIECKKNFYFRVQLIRRDFIEFLHLYINIRNVLFDMIEGETKSKIKV